MCRELFSCRKGDKDQCIMFKTLRRTVFLFLKFMSSTEKKKPFKKEKYSEIKMFFKCIFKTVVPNSITSLVFIDIS